ncbi:hypothetical protein BJX99DRAFT_234089 [Aspergillus californicus]
MKYKPTYFRAVERQELWNFMGNRAAESPTLKDNVVAVKHKPEGDLSALRPT